MKKSQIIIAVALSAMLLVGCKHKEKEKSLPDYSETPLTAEIYRELLLTAQENTLGENGTNLDDITVKSGLVTPYSYKKDNFFCDKSSLGSEKSIFLNPDDGKYYDYENHSVFTSSNHYREIDEETFISKMGYGKQKIEKYFVDAFTIALAILDGTSEDYPNATVSFYKLSGGRKEMVAKAKYTAMEYNQELQSEVEVEKTKTVMFYIKNQQLVEIDHDGDSSSNYKFNYGGASYTIPAKPAEGE